MKKNRKADLKLDEVMSEKELGVLRELQAKAKRIEREKSRFLAQVLDNREAVLAYLGIDDNNGAVLTDDIIIANREHILAVLGIKEDDSRIMSELVTRYGASRDMVVAHILSDRQIEYFRRNRNN